MTARGKSETFIKHKHKHKQGVKVPWSGWHKEAPRIGSERNEMYAKCKKRSSCFLGKGTSYPICKKGTCKKSRKGIYAAFLRARQHHQRRVTLKAFRLLRNKQIK